MLEIAQQSFNFIHLPQNWGKKNGGREWKPSGRFCLVTTAKPNRSSLSVLKALILLNELNMISLMIKSKTSRGHEKFLSASY